MYRLLAYCLQLYIEIDSRTREIRLGIIRLDVVPLDSSHLSFKLSNAVLDFDPFVYIVHLDAITFQCEVSKFRILIRSSSLSHDRRPSF